MYNNFLSLICSESNTSKEKCEYKIFNIFSPNIILISYDVIFESIRKHEIKIANENKSKSQYLEVNKILLEGEKNM